MTTTNNNKTITIKNVSSSMVYITVPEIDFRREMTPGRSIKIDKDVYDDLSFDVGFASLVRGHYLKVEGLSEDEVVEDVGTIVESSEIAKMLDEKDITKFAKFIPQATQAEKETVVKFAIDKNIADPGFAALINKYCGVDVIHAISVKSSINAK